MSDKEGTERLIHAYLTKVEKHFPGWLEKKDAKQEEILSQIEERIQETAENISEEKKITESSVKHAISQIGTPKSVLREYIQRGTPKIFITEEWWPYYKKMDDRNRSCGDSSPHCILSVQPLYGTNDGSV